MNDVILDVKDLKKYYEDVKAVDGVSFSIKKGHVYSILGPNGAGKTTAIEIIEGLRDKDSGRILFFGKEVDTIGRAEKERIGVQLQETNFFPHLKVDESIDLFKSFFPDSIPKEKVLDIAMLHEQRKSLIEKLSGGQKQRLAIALALVNDPDIVFLDEPTTGLDPQARRNIWESIKKLKAKKKTIILTTHYMEEAEELSDYIFIMDHGKIIKEGTKTELIDSLDLSSVIEFEVSGENPIQSFHQSGMHGVKSIGNNRFEVNTNNFINDFTVLSRAIQNNGLELKNVILRQPNLEDVFLHLTGRKLRD
jgi:ABC-2 type transport system ATP-binding protein